MKILIVRGSGFRKSGEAVDLSPAERIEKMKAEQKLDREIRQILKRLFDEKEIGDEEDDAEGTDRHVPTLH